MATGQNFGPPVTAYPNWGVRSAADTVLAWESISLFTVTRRFKENNLILPVEQGSQTQIAPRAKGGLTK